MFGATIAQNLVPWVLNKIFSTAKIKTDTRLGSSSKQNKNMSQKMHPCPQCLEYPLLGELNHTSIRLLTFLQGFLTVFLTVLFLWIYFHCLLSVAASNFFEWDQFGTVFLSTAWLLHAQFLSMSRGQPHKPNVNHSIFSFWQSDDHPKSCNEFESLYWPGTKWDLNRNSSNLITMS